ncbi:RNA polymerase sigma factor [Chryseolinea lacunae]|uniref:Sigma-70 family RNA polymerase sigma factor n=1 Tax=Chryseolinea lacunae TaxID=2801331 RepID=A0ABS1KU97_9BACT|nr:sigma-70 family RNA polymerase sigma factor [Chryseolinea lacunae]MBL0743039.1 sigma-70 family RNA polymerase sigma factor [Chryseolinea lacunae]
MHSMFDEDESLWLKIKSGDRESLEMLYRKLFGMLYRYGTKFTSSKLVKDAIHDMFLDIWNYREKLQPTTSVRYYLFTTLKRRIVLNNQNHRRFSTFNYKSDWISVAADSSHEEIIIESECDDARTRKLRKYMQDLPPRQYEALLMKFYNKLSYREIADKLDVNEQSARNLVQRGLELLRKYSQITLLGLILLCRTIDKVW